MASITFNQYHINTEHLKEIKNVQEMIDDPRFLHQETGKEREALCKKLFNQVNPKKVKKDADEPTKSDN